MKDKKGKLFVIVGPSGVGKGTLVAAILDNTSDIKLSISATTRNPRPGEEHGVNYFYLSKAEFLKSIEQNKFLEWAEFAGNYYGTFTDTVKENLNKGMDLVLEIDVQGAMQIKEKIKEAVMIFILPPSIEELKKRLRDRNTETEEAMNKRLLAMKSELQQKDQFDYQLVNDDFQLAVTELEEIINTERNK